MLFCVHESHERQLMLWSFTPLTAAAAWEEESPPFVFLVAQPSGPFQLFIYYMIIARCTSILYAAT